MKFPRTVTYKLWYFRYCREDLGKPSKNKMCKFHDNLQIGWGGHGLKTHFKKDRNCDKSPRGVGEITKRHNFHTLKFCFETV